MIYYILKFETFLAVEPVDSYRPRRNESPEVPLTVDQISYNPFLTYLLQFIVYHCPICCYNLHNWKATLFNLIFIREHITSAVDAIHVINARTVKRTKQFAASTWLYACLTCTYFPVALNAMRAAHSSC